MGQTERWLELPGAGPQLGGRLTRYIGFSKGIAAPVRRRELPSRHITVMISFGDPLVVVGEAGDRPRVVRSFVSGLQTESAVTERFGHQYGIHVELAPLAAYSIFGLPMHTLANTLVDLPAVLGKDFGQLVERLALAKDWPDRFARLQAALAQRMADGRPPTPEVVWAWHRLRAANGSVRVEQLVKQSGRSHRHLVARFRDELGVTPKDLARVLRFEHSLNLLRQTGAPFADVATAAGYYDQAHFNREFRALAGCSPGALIGTRAATDLRGASR